MDSKVIFIAIVSVIGIATALEFGERMDLIKMLCFNDEPMSGCDGAICRILFSDSEADESYSAPVKRYGKSKDPSKPGPVKGFLRFGRKRRSVNADDLQKRSVKPFLRYGRSRASSLYWPKQEAESSCERIESLLNQLLAKDASKLGQLPSTQKPNAE